MSSIPPVSDDGQSLDYMAPVAQPKFSADHVANQKSAGKAPRQSRDGAQYVRQQRGHSFIIQFLVLGIFTLWILPIYYAVSPNHYYHI